MQKSSQWAKTYSESIIKPLQQRSCTSWKAVTLGYSVKGIFWKNSQKLEENIYDEVFFYNFILIKSNPSLVLSYEYCKKFQKSYSAGHLYSISDQCSLSVLP